jgi:potassium efflux system protein
MEFWQHIKNIWAFKIWVLDAHPVTLGRLIVAILLLIFGLYLSKYVVTRVARRIRPHTSLRESTSATIEKIVLYSAYVLVILWALAIIDIPLAAFAFVGGALAIGVGFGAQNIINNFISGFIIMAEHPIRIGDLVEVDKVLGRVEEIGARCTQIRTGENIHILVPNSKFLETNITNWTFSDNKIRTKVVVGVAYGSPVREVERILVTAVEEEPRVLKDEKPVVVFNDFGNSALIFEVYFWISVKTVMERKLLESHIRFRVDEMFRGAGIVIAFPQRDTHLDSKEPLQIRLLSE